jgi:hypothetical protein
VSTKGEMQAGGLGGLGEGKDKERSRINRKGVPRRLYFPALQ